jgi:HK97 family phage prohead protease
LVDSEVRVSEDGRSIVGLAAVYYDGTENTEYLLWGDTIERIMPGTFDRAIAEDDVRGLFNHDVNLVLGRSASDTLQLQSLPEGLEYVIAPGDTTIGRDVPEYIRRGDVSGSSFSFVVTDEEWKKEDGREIREIGGVQLFDVGPVTFPAYEATTAAMRCADAKRSYEVWKSIERGKVRQLRESRLRQRRARVVEIGT